MAVSPITLAKLTVIYRYYVGISVPNFIQTGQELAEVLLQIPRRP